MPDDRNACAKILHFLDSRCAFHVCHDKGLFSTYRSTKCEKVPVVYGDTCDVTGMGEVRIKLFNVSEMLLDDIRHVPILKKI